MKSLVTFTASLLTICQISFAGGGGPGANPCNPVTEIVKEYTVTTQYDELIGQGFPITDVMTASLVHFQCTGAQAESVRKELHLKFEAQNSIMEPKVAIAIINSEGKPMSMDITSYLQVDGNVMTIALTGDSGIGLVTHENLSEILHAIEKDGASVSFNINGFRTKIMFIQN